MHLILLLVIVFQTGCASSEGQKKTATPVGPTSEPVTPTQPTETSPAVLTISPSASATIPKPTFEPTGTPTPRIQDVLPAQQGIGFGAYLDVRSADSGLALMKAEGMNWIHLPFYWSAVEPQEGQINWGAFYSFENKLRTAADDHINIILYINDTPGWALKEGYTCGAVAQDKFADLASFLSDMVARYSVAPFNVKYYELWSEEDVSGALGCWGDPGDPKYFGGGYYGEMLKVVYPAIKAANPQAQVLFGGLLMDCDPDHVANCGGDLALKTSIGHFLEGALVDGAGPYFDGISFHAYDYYMGALGKYSNSNWGAAWNTTGPVVLVKAAYLRNLLARYNITGKYLMNTELAVLCGSTGKEPVCTTADHEATVSAYIVQAYAAGIANGLPIIIWFSLAGWRGTGLVDAQLNPLPTYNAYKNVRALLGLDDYVRAITEFQGITGYEFIDNYAKQRTWVLWSVTATGNPHAITLSTMPLAVYDTYGAALPVGMTLNVNLEPVFIVFGA